MEKKCVLELNEFEIDQIQAAISQYLYEQMQEPNSTTDYMENLETLSNKIFEERSNLVFNDTIFHRSSK